MPNPARRGPGRRLILTVAALASVIVGYYLGQYWQRRPLAELTAVIYPAGRPVVYPAGLDISAGPATEAPWRLFLVADTRAAECKQLLRHYASVFNRLAAWPKIQENLRLNMLAYDQPDVHAVTEFTGGVGWAEIISADPDELDTFAMQLGIQPDPAGAWCSAMAANAILVAPDQKRWALIPFEQAAIMARNIRTIIAFVE